MKSTHISTLSVSLALRSSTAKLQASLPRLQQELVTGKHADSGLSLGAESRKLASFKNDINHISRLIDTNAQVKTRLSMTQESMSRLNGLASDLMNAVGIVLGDPSENFAAELTANNVLAEMTAILNTQANGVFLFSGVNSDTKPIADYAGGPGKAAFDAAFLGHFGFTKNDPAAAALTAADIDNFLTVSAEPLFMGAAWNTNMSTATDEVTISRISAGVTAETSVSANDASFRRLMLAAVVGVELYDSNLGGEALQQVSEYIISSAGSAAGSLTELQGETGLVEERLRRASDHLTAQKSLLETFASEMESIDPYKTSIELNTLLTQVETSYSITSRIQTLSIMRFL
ncbi:flagellar hook-associated family protein [Oricola cellulosilytica]|uniref:Flagellin n=1 Tax=Oricola cellulosilytica TaxID=1429082 RepID=A0A4R0PEI6_9HYPH|nr:flagellar hook-associated family protein [Oricola cellulosilytica]TCD16217.1 flagellar hook-associated family protein [Oricola cellulosilytica]